MVGSACFIQKNKPKDVLPYYATTFDSVELNNSFYQIPKEKI
ncbi:DUF72 domain-containing protein [Legionella tunisiensis]